MKVRIYSTPMCPFCKAAKQFFRENDVEYEELNVAESDEARDEMIKKSGQMSVPVIDIDGDIIIGFNTEKLKHSLNLEG